MSRLIKLVIVAAAAVGMFAVSAAAASAHEFKAAKYPVEVEAVQKNDQGFQITGAVSVCKKAKFKTGEEKAPNPTGPVETLEVHPVYTECSVELAGTHTATVETKGCNYRFHAAEPKTTNGSVDVVCESGKQIEVHVHELECTIFVPGQVGLKTVEYINEEGKVRVKANITGIKYSTNCPLEVKEGSTGIYREGKFNAKSEPELGLGPAEALATGFEPKTATKISIEVS